jgi:hypothetical protein
MAAELVAPTDEITGFPYLIAPKKMWLPLDNPDVANRHHVMHPGNDPFFRTVAGAAVRCCMVQTTEVELHNYGVETYHQSYKESWYRRDVKGVLSTVIPAVAGVLPGGVIEMSSRGPIERLMTTKEREYFLTPHPTDKFGYRYLSYGYGQIRDFLSEVVTSQDLSHIRQSRIDEFLNTTDRDKKKKIGHMLLLSAIGVTSDLIREDYFTYRRTGMMHPGMPPEPQQLMLYKLGNIQRLDRLFPQLETNLAAAA